MRTNIICDRCGWKAPGNVLAWYFKRCPRCAARVINLKDIGCWAMLRLLVLLDRLLRLTMKNPPATVTLHYSSAMGKFSYPDGSSLQYETCPCCQGVGRVMNLFSMASRPCGRCAGTGRVISPQKGAQ